jgi:hypothetical protein
VKYKKYENQAGPTYTLMKSDIFMIKYENGDKDMFKDAPSAVSAPTAAVSKQQDVLSYTHSFWTGTTIRNGAGKSLSKAEIRSIMLDVPEALNSFNSGAALHTAGWILCGAGYGFLALALIDLYSSDYTSDTWLYWDMAALGCFTATIIVDAIGNAKWRSAVNLYNSAKSNPHASRTSLNFGLTRSGGIGLTLTF